MNDNNLIELMPFKEKGQKISPLFVSRVNEKFIIAAYQGGISKYDIRIRYRQKKEKGWSKIRTPKHIHWADDILIKMHSKPEKTKEFLDFLLKVWNEIKPIKSEEQRKKILNIERLLKINQKEIEKYKDLSQKGKYSIKFLILLARLLMLQEKTNLEAAYMFKNLLEALKAGEDIF